MSSNLGLSVLVSVSLFLTGYQDSTGLSWQIIAVIISLMFAIESVIHRTWFPLLVFLLVELLKSSSFDIVFD